MNGQVINGQCVSSRLVGECFLVTRRSAAGCNEAILVMVYDVESIRLLGAIINWITDRRSVYYPTIDLSCTELFMLFLRLLSRWLLYIQVDYINNAITCCRFKCSLKCGCHFTVFMHWNTNYALKSSYFICCLICHEAFFHRRKLNIYLDVEQKSS